MSTELIPVKPGWRWADKKPINQDKWNHWLCNAHSWTRGAMLSSSRWDRTSSTDPSGQGNVMMMMMVIKNTTYIPPVKHKPSSRINALVLPIMHFHSDKAPLLFPSSTTCSLGWEVSAAHVRTNELISVFHLPPYCFHNTQYVSEDVSCQAAEEE